MKQRIYIDTSVIGGYHDDEFAEHTRKLFERIINMDFEIYFSEVNETELVLAPQEVRDVKDLIPQECFKFLELSADAKQLAEIYISEKALAKQV